MAYKGDDMKRLTFLIFLLLPSLAVAGTGSGKIVGYIPYSTATKEMFFIKVETLGNTPACNTTARFAMRDDNLRYKMTQAAALAAFMSGTKVTVRGLGTCNAAGNSEDISYMCLGTTPC